MAKYELGVADRLNLLGVLPVEGDYKTLKYLRTLREELGFDVEEQENLKFKTENGMHMWNTENEVKVELDIEKPIEEEVIAKLKKLNEDKKLRDNLIPLYELFVEKEENPDK